MTFVVAPIGHVRGGRAAGADDDWGGVTARIELTPAFGAEALAGLADFSHAEVIFLFDRVPLGAGLGGRPDGGVLVASDVNPDA